jgi:AcrR family transcriptional regulator
VARQARGAATRQKILEAAVELFTDNGFGVTTLNDIADRAELTSGALYYHFESKEALAIGIIDEGWPKTWDLIVKHLDSAALGLESVIRMTFALTDLMQRDNLLWLAHHLGHTFGQANLEARDGCQKRMTMFIDRVAEAVRPSDLGDGITAQAVGTYVWLVRPDAPVRLHVATAGTREIGDLVARIRLSLAQSSRRAAQPHGPVSVPLGQDVDTQP